MRFESFKDLAEKYAYRIWGLTCPLCGNYFGIEGCPVPGEKVLCGWGGCGITFMIQEKHNE